MLHTFSPNIGAWDGKIQEFKTSLGFMRACIKWEGGVMEIPKTGSLSSPRQTELSSVQGPQCPELGLEKVLMFARGTYE